MRHYLVLGCSLVVALIFGEEDPEHANAHEDARRLNRRVALIVRLQP